MKRWGEGRMGGSKSDKVEIESHFSQVAGARLPPASGRSSTNSGPRPHASCCRRIFASRLWMEAYTFVLSQSQGSYWKKTFHVKIHQSYRENQCTPQFTEPNDDARLSIRVNALCACMCMCVLYIFVYLFFLTRAFQIKFSSMLNKMW